MSIQFTKSFQTKDGNVFGSLELAQQHEINLVLKEIGPPISDELRMDVVSRIIEHADAIMDVLTTKKTSRPNGRAINGAKRTRKPKTTTEATV